MYNIGTSVISISHRERSFEQRKICGPRTSGTCAMVDHLTYWKRHSLTGYLRHDLAVYIHA